MQNNPFGNLSTDGLEQAGDRLGGGGVFESGVYDGTIKYAFAGAADSGAKFFEIHVDTNDGRTYRERMYVTNKQGQNYWTDKNKKKNPLPGFTIANDLALLSTGFPLPEQEFEEKAAMLYDFEAKSEVAKKVQMATGMIGKPISIAVLKQIEDKTKKNDTTGEYEPTGETRETNVIDKVFHNETRKTVSEFTAEKDAEFEGKWLEKNKGKVVDRAKSVAGKAGAPGQAGKSGAPAAAGGKPKSLFGGG